MPQTEGCGIQEIVGNEVLLVSKGDVRLEGEREAILYAGAHNQWMIALKDLQVVHVAVVGAVVRIFGYNLEFLPFCLKIILHHVGAMAFFAKCERGGDTIATVRRGDREDVAHAIELYLLFHSKAVLAGDSAALKGPNDLTAT